MLTITDLSKQYGQKDGASPVLSHVNFQVNEGDFVAVLGKSGCGKTTLLRLMGGFIPPDSGAVLLDGRPVTAPSSQMVMVFQSFDQLFPWYTLEQNITYALKKAKKIKDPSSRKNLARSYLSMTGLLEFKDQYPSALSGGMKQRGALARAMALKPRLLLMDEPFSSLDYLTRKQAQASLKGLAADNRSTVILVTHDIEEALTLGTRIAVLDSHTHTVSRRYDNPDDFPHLREELEEALR